MSSPFLLVTDYQRMKVDQFGELRNRLASTGAEVHVIKNSFLKAFAAEFKIATLKIGVIDRAVLSTADVEALADLPARDALLAQLLGVLLAPATKLVRVLNEPAASLARLLQAKATKDGANVKVADKQPTPEPVASQPEAQVVAEPITAASESIPAEPKTESTEGEAPAAEVAGS